MEADKEQGLQIEVEQLTKARLYEIDQTEHFTDFKSYYESSPW